MLGAASLDFLGHQVDRHGIHPLEDKVTAVQQFPQPKSSQKLCQFLGLVNFYHHFIPGCAHVLQALHDLITGSANGDQHLTWTLEVEAAFTEVKEAFVNTTLLVHPHGDTPTCLITDASEVAVGAVLQLFP